MQSSSSSSAAYSTTVETWQPSSADERQYYDQLFQMADEMHQNAVGGRAAVAFFMRSKLDKSQLREIWNVANARQQAELSRSEFYVAMRLISLAQQGEPATKDSFLQSAGKSYPMPRLTGAPPPPQPKPKAPTPPSSTSGNGYAVSESEKTKYDGIFQQYDTDHDGLLHGKEAVSLFQLSGLDRDTLRSVWNMADRGKDGYLDIKEFYIAMHLIVCVSKRNLSMPLELPQDLLDSIFEASVPTNDAFTGFSGDAMSMSNSMHSLTSQSTQGQQPKVDPMDAFASLSVTSDAEQPPVTPTVPAPVQQPSMSSQSLQQQGDQFGAQPNMMGFGSSMPSAEPRKERSNSGSSLGAMSLSSLHAPSEQFDFTSMGQQMYQAKPSGMNMNVAPVVQETPSPTKPFMSEEQELQAAKQLDRQSKATIETLSALEERQTMVETLSKQLKELDQLRSDLASLCLRRETLRATASSMTSTTDSDPKEMLSKRTAENNLKDLVSSTRQHVEALETEVADCEEQVREMAMRPPQGQVTPPTAVSEASFSADQTLQSSTSSFTNGHGSFVPLNQHESQSVSEDGMDASFTPSLKPSEAPTSDAFSDFGTSYATVVNQPSPQNETTDFFADFEAPKASPSSVSNDFADLGSSVASDTARELPTSDSVDLFDSQPEVSVPPLAEASQSSTDNANFFPVDDEKETVASSREGLNVSFGASFTSDNAGQSSATDALDIFSSAEAVAPPRSAVADDFADFGSSFSSDAPKSSPVNATTDFFGTSEEPPKQSLDDDFTSSFSSEPKQSSSNFGTDFFGPSDATEKPSGDSFADFGSSFSSDAPKASDVNDMTDFFGPQEETPKQSALSADFGDFGSSFSSNPPPSSSNGTSKPGEDASTEFADFADFESAPASTSSSRQDFDAFAAFD